MNKFQKLVLATSLTALPITATFASDAQGPGDSDSLWVLGGGVITASNPYENEDSKGMFLPNIQYNGERFFFKNGSFNFSAFQAKDFSFGLTAHHQQNFLNDDSEFRSNVKLRGLSKRDNAVEAGFYVNHTTDLGRLNFKLVSDVSNSHKGQTANLNYTFDITAGDWHINPTLGMQWMSDNKTNHLYGVSAAEANAVRAAYDANSATNLFAGVRVRRDITEHLDLTFQSSYTRLDKSISNSSIIEDKYQYHAGIGLNYNF